MSFSGARFKKCRERAGYSQERLREEINRRLDPQEQIGRSSIGAWENGRSKKPHALPLSVAAEVLGVSVDAFDYTPAEEQIANYVDNAERREAEDLKEWGFIPGFFEFLEKTLGCGIETRGVYWSPETNQYWKHLSPNDPTPSLSHDVIGGITVREDNIPRRRVDIDSDYWGDSMFTGAIIHYTNKKKDQFIPMTSLYRLQYRLGRLAWFMLQEMVDDPDEEKAISPRFGYDDECREMFGDYVTFEMEEAMEPRIGNMTPYKKP